jgi:hypothetical protein
VTFGGITLLYAVTVAFSFVNVAAMKTSSWGSSGLFTNLIFLGAMFTFPVMGFLVATRHPRNAVGWVMLAIGVVWGLGFLMDNYVGYGIVTNPGSLPRPDVVLAISESGWIPGIGLIGIYLLLLFPDGHLPSPRWRPVAWVAGAMMVLAVISITFSPGRFTDSGYATITNPLGIESLHSLLSGLQFSIIFIPIALLVSAVGLVMRFRRSRGQQRVQMKWFASAAALVAAIYLIAMVLTFNRPTDGWVEWTQNIALFSFVLIPAATGIAILKYRLYEIDRIINRTIVYAVLTALLGGLYLGSVFAFQAALTPLTRKSDLAVAASTLVVAALFGPLRRRIQSFIDKRFYRRRFDTQRTLESFSSRVRDEVDLPALSQQLVDVVRETMQPASVSLWLRDQKIS